MDQTEKTVVRLAQLFLWDLPSYSKVEVAHQPFVITEHANFREMLKLI
ncbi:MAG: hypothetical protein NVS3B20_26320 [Polyangiales bacterium]